MTSAIALLFTVCLSNSPAECHEVRYTFEDASVSVEGCMVKAQPYIAEWIEREKGVYFFKPDSIRCKEEIGVQEQKA